jgi:hypothetical protein
MKEAIEHNFHSELSSLIVPCIDHVLKQVSHPLGERSSLLVHGVSLADEAQEYTATLLRGDRHTASTMVMKIREHITIEDTYNSYFPAVPI